MYAENHRLNLIKTLRTGTLVMMQKNRWEKIDDEWKPQIDK